MTNKILHATTSKKFHTNTRGKTYGRCLVSGDGKDVYIPEKMTKASKWFGFVTFNVVYNPNKLDGRLNQIWIDTYKMKVNLSKHERQQTKENRSACRGTRYTAQMIKGVNFADVVKRKGAQKKLPNDIEKDEVE
ncbi:hypothetical protein VNO77_25826 [Canavalia gladiata]|uniref:Uncharacterized protein n=1 Tax=Canavalia gladiata TaxID=3824 RepID=A0AAN9Q4Z2_CANGL